MFKKIGEMSIQSKLWFLTSVFVVGFIAFGAIALATINTVRINGEQYGRIVRNKDLLADVLPPPNYIVETYLNVELLTNAKTASERQPLVERIKTLKKEYNARQEFWKGELAVGSLKTEVVETSRVPAEAFFAAIDQHLLPALEKGDRATAREVLDTRLAPLFAEHRASIDKIVAKAGENASATEASVALLISRMVWGMSLSGLALLSAACGISWWIRRSAIQQLLGDTAQVVAINRSQAVIEFALDGTILHANENFLNTMGYSLDEIKGRHHSLFVSDAHRHSPEYREFWSTLNRGEFIGGEFLRMSKGNREVWIQASYNPIFDMRGKPFKVVKYATEITAQVHARNEMARILDLVDSNATTLGSSAEELSAVSTQMSANADETSAQATVVSAASEQVSKNVQVVATGVEEMNAAIREIAKNASDSARVAQQAVTTAAAANASISKLGDSSAEIGKVIKVITSIAEQTNLLALNATIEAARAGEAGKGFAVVANEVKELAKETAKATEDISRKIEAIQGDTRGAVDSIRKIDEVITVINDISNTIASAVEEQTATATEMSRNVTEAAKGTSEIAQNITSVAQAAQNTSQGAVNCQQAASELATMAVEMQQLSAGRGESSSAGQNARQQPATVEVANRNRSNARRDGVFIPISKA